MCFLNLTIKLFVGVSVVGRMYDSIETEKGNYTYTPHNELFHRLTRGCAVGLAVACDGARACVENGWWLLV